MRKMIIAAAAAGFLAITAPAFAGDGPAGTSEGQDNIGTDEAPTYQENNSLDCGDEHAADAGNGIVVNAQGGAEGGALVVCNDGEAAPIQGRIIAAGGTEGGWVGVDGTDYNPAEAQGYLRVDINSGGPSVRSGSVEAYDTDSANPGEGASSENWLSCPIRGSVLTA